jgi:hypothetical protein
MTAAKRSIRLNRRLLTTSTFDSGALGVLVHVIHRFPAAGTYQAVVLRDDQRVGTTCFRVTDGTAGTQLNVDLAAIATPAGAPCACREHPESAPAVSPDGYVLFHAPAGAGGYAVLVGEAKEGGRAAFDSRALKDGDLFALALIEPATYAVTSPGGSGRAEIEVAAIPPGTNLRTVAPVYVDATRTAFKPARIAVHAGQGVVFRMKGAPRVVIEKRAPQAAPRRGRAAAAPAARRVRRHVRIRRLGFGGAGGQA